MASKHAAPSAAESSPHEGYTAQLDGLRAFAIFAVMMQHFLPRGSWIYSLVPWGGIGVTLFFVLSGFLVTQTLLKRREAGLENPGLKLWKFYVTRWLRIIPAYYTVLAIGALFFLPVRESFFWHATYLSNIFFIRLGYFEEYVAHFWYLAVDQQFYLLWALAVMFLSLRSTFNLAIAMILLAPVFRGLMLYKPEVAQVVLPFGWLDALGMGSLWALSVHEGIRPFLQKAFGSNLLGWSLFVTIMAIYQAHGDVTWVFGQVVMCFAFTWLISVASLRQKTLLRQFLGLKPLVYLGRISYSVYLWHLFVPYFLFMTLVNLKIPYPESKTIEVAMLCGVSVTIGAVSWHLIEQPTMRLKRLLKVDSPQKHL